MGRGGVSSTVRRDELEHIFDPPNPSRLSEIPTEPDQRTILVTAIMPLVREDMETKAVKKTLTIPAWLNRAAEAAHVNFSALLQRSLREHLGIQDRYR